MAKTLTKRRAKNAGAKKHTSVAARAAAGKFCELPEVPQRVFTPDVGPERARLIRNTDRKWANGTTLHYHFLSSPAAWQGSAQDRRRVTDAFAAWKRLGIGLDFQEVASADEAEIRIGFERGGGHWSYIGRDVLGAGQSDRTMNLDKGDVGTVDTAIHEIGHTLGFPHEHQNPNAGIEWNEEAVYADLSGPPNNWPREQTFHNIIRKLNPGDVHGSAWDKDSIMHYPFKAGLINRPERYRTEALRPAPGLSPVDKEEVKSFYSPLQISDHRALQAFQFVRLTLAPRGQANFIINPASSRRYQFSTFGQADTVMALFEEVNGVPRFREADDDSGADRNAKFTARLFPGRRALRRVRLGAQHRRGEFGVMMW